MVDYKYTILYVKDVVKTVTFYEKAFGFQRKFVSPELDYGELATGSTTISFASLELANANLKKGFTESTLQTKPFGIELGFTTLDVQGVVKQAIEAGATEVEQLQVKPWGQEVAYLRDCNGFLIEICSPVEN